MVEQSPLFELAPEQPPTPAGGRTFLSHNARVFGCLVESKTLARLVAQAARSTAKKHGSNRSAADPFEVAVKDRILEPVNAAQIAAETVEICGNCYPESRDLVKVELSDGPGKGDPLADLLIRFRFDRGRTVTVATNIKRLQPTTNKPEGGSLLSFVRLATEPGYDPADPPRNIGFDADHTILEWFAGRRKILDARDYLILACRIDGGRLGGIEAWGTLAGVDANGKPIVTRHGNRAVIYTAKPSGTLDPSTDVNAEISAQLLPAATPSSLRAHLAALVAKRDGIAAARDLTTTLLDLVDNDLLGRFLTAVNPVD